MKNFEKQIIEALKKNSSTHKFDHAGFTLIELMVVVAIIGVLSALAIPSFQTYVSKTRQSEAKLDLSNLYTSETSFYTQTGTYSACLYDIGFQPTGVNLYYAVGTGPTSGSCGSTGQAQCGQTFTTPTGGGNCQLPPTGVTYGGGGANNFPAYYPTLTANKIYSPATVGARATGVPVAVQGMSFVQTMTSIRFTGIATGNVSAVNTSGANGAGIDIWQINETNSLVNAQPIY